MISVGRILSLSALLGTAMTAELANQEIQANPGILAGNTSETTPAPLTKDAGEKIDTNLTKPFVEDKGVELNLTEADGGMPAPLTEKKPTDGSKLVPDEVEAGFGKAIMKYITEFNTTLSNMFSRIGSTMTTATSSLGLDKLIPGNVTVFGMTITPTIMLMILLVALVIIGLLLYFAFDDVVAVIFYPETSFGLYSKVKSFFKEIGAKIKSLVQPVRVYVRSFFLAKKNSTAYSRIKLVPFDAKTSVIN